MSETAQLIELLRQQLETQRKQMETLVAALSTGGSGLSTNPIPTSQTAVVSIPSFVPFDSSSELWYDYWARFQTFAGANSVPADKTAQVFLTNQSRVTYKLLFNLTAQQSPRKDVNALSMDEIDPLDEAMRTRFICSVDNEAILMALFRIKDNDLTFAKAIAVAVETEEATKVAKETVYGTSSTSSSSVNKVQGSRKQSVQLQAWQWERSRFSPGNMP
ncbi:hypothetical protein EMCRGX_G023228 [Ephydatia muelleri]